MNKYLILSMVFFLLACSSSQNIKKEYRLKKEEKEYKNNKISSSKDKYLDLFFSYLDNNYEYFMEKSKGYLKNSDDLAFSLYTSLKLINLYERYYISYDNLISILNISKNPFVKLYIHLLEKQHKFEYLDQKTYSKLFSFSKLTYNGYYRFFSIYDFYNPKELEKKINRKLNFKKGKIKVPDILHNNLSNKNIHKFTSYFHSDKNKDITFFISSKNSMFRIVLDDKELFINDLFADKINNLLVKKIKLKKGSHKIEIFMMDKSSIYLYSDKSLKKAKNQLKKSSFTVSKDYNKDIFKELFSYKLSSELKNTFAYSISKNIENIYSSYNYLKELNYDNFYKDFLYYDYFSNFINSNKYLNNSLKKNKKFLEARFLYLNTIKDKNEQLKYIKDIKKKGLEYYYYLINIYEQLSLNSKVVEILSEVNFREFIYEIENIIKKYNIKLFNNNYKLVKYLNGKDLLYIKNLILTNPYSGKYKNLLNIIKEKDEKLYLSLKKELVNNFYDLKYKEKLEKIEDIKKFLDNSKFSDNFIAKILESGTYKKLFNDNILDLIKIGISKESNNIDIIDHDIVFIDNSYFSVYLNRKVKKITSKISLDKSSILKRKNYLRVNVIDGKTFEIKAQNLLNSNGVLYNLKEGDYLDIITFDRLLLPVNFVYKNNNRFLKNAKLDIYIDKNIKNDIKISYSNNFKKNNVKEIEGKTYKEIHYSESDISSFKTKDFLPSSSKYKPSITISKKINYKNELINLQNSYIFSSYPFPFTKELFKKYPDIKSKKDLLNVVDMILKKYSHSNDNMNNIAYNSRGDLFYFLHSLLKSKKVKSEIIFVHNTRSPNISVYSADYYDSKLLKVYFNSKEYYFDLSSPFTKQFDIKAYYKKECLRVMNNGNIVKDILPESKPLDVKNILNIKVNKNNELIVDLKIYSSPDSRAELKKVSKEKIKNIFSSFIIHKIGEVENIYFNVKNSDNRLEDFIIEYSFKKKLSDFSKKELYELISMWDFVSYPLFYHYTIRENRDVDLKLNHYYSKSKITLSLKNSYFLKDLDEIRLKESFGYYLRTIRHLNSNYEINSEYYIRESIVDKKLYKKLKNFSNKIQKTLFKEISIEK